MAKPKEEFAYTGSEAFLDMRKAKQGGLSYRQASAKFLRFDPMTGDAMSLESTKVTAEEFRRANGPFAAWLYNPWSGKLRDAGDIGSDMFGLLIM